MLLKISLIFINVSEGIFVEKIEGRKVCSPALQLAPILDPPLIMTAVQASDGEILRPTIGAVAARPLSPLLLASLHACLQTGEILTGCPTDVKREDTSPVVGASDVDSTRDSRRSLGTERGGQNKSKGQRALRQTDSVQSGAAGSDFSL